MINRVPNQWTQCPCFTKKQSKIVKNGFQNGKQRFLCKNCGKSFIKKYTYNAYNGNINYWIKMLLCEGVGILGISRLLKISKNTVLSRMLKIADSLKKPIWIKPNCTFELDEMWTYIGNKKKGIYIAYGIERKTARVIDFRVGQRSYNLLRQIVNTVLETKPDKIFTDKFPFYQKLVPKEKHKISKYHINKIERNNLNLRTHIKRLSRRSICFSKSAKYLEAHLSIYFWGQLY